MGRAYQLLLAVLTWNCLCWGAWSLARVENNWSNRRPNVTTYNQWQPTPSPAQGSGWNYGNQWRPQPTYNASSWQRPGSQPQHQSPYNTPWTRQNNTKYGTTTPRTVINRWGQATNWNNIQPGGGYRPQNTTATGIWSGRPNSTYISPSPSPPSPSSWTRNNTHSGWGSAGNWKTPSQQYPGVQPQNPNYGNWGQRSNTTRLAPTTPTPPVQPANRPSNTDIGWGGQSWGVGGTQWSAGTPGSTANNQPGSNQPSWSPPSPSYNLTGFDRNTGFYGSPSSQPSSPSQNPPYGSGWHTGTDSTHGGVSAGSAPLAPLGGNSQWSTGSGSGTPLAPIGGGSPTSWNSNPAGLSYSGGLPTGVGGATTGQRNTNTNPYANMFN